MERRKMSNFFGEGKYLVHRGEEEERREGKVGKYIGEGLSLGWREDCSGFVTGKGLGYVVTW